MTPIYAAIDLGSNNCRLLIAKPGSPDDTPENRMKIIDAYSCSVRLGGGISKNKRLDPAAMSRAREALRICAAKIKTRGAERIYAIATEACRQAENAQDFLDLVKVSPGLSVDIISPIEEAKLAWSGCLPLAVPSRQKILIFDIGGASTQVILGEAVLGDHKTATITDPQTTIIDWKWPEWKWPEWKWINWLSVPTGVLTLFDQYGAGPFTLEKTSTIQQELAKPFVEFAQRHDLVLDEKTTQIIATSGTVTTLAGSLMGLPRYDRAKVDGTWLSREKAYVLADELAVLTPAQRRHYGCIGPGRADLIVAGTMILRALWTAFPVPWLRVADRGLREGMLTIMMREDGYDV